MNRPAAFAALAAALLACGAARLTLFRGLDGSLHVGWSHEASDLRLGAVACATAAGAALSLAGLLLQGMFRNPLASPFVLGLSSGSQAAVAALTLAAFRMGLTAPPGMEMLAGTLGAAAALLACVAFGGRGGRWLDPVSLVLAGVVVASMAGSLATLFEWILPPAERASLLAWAVGRIPESPEPVVLGLVAGCVLAAGVGGWVAGRGLDALQLSDDEAMSVGLPLFRWRLGIVLVASALAAAATALCGPLAFVGLVGPHAARSFVGPSHRHAVPAAMLAGASLLLLADVVRILLPVDGGGRMPVGVVCALAGGPAFLILLRRGAARSWSP